MRTCSGCRILTTVTIVLLLLLVTPEQSAAYSSNPFQGQGVAPPGTVKIYLSVAVERVLHVDQQNYRFQAIVYYFFSWRDPRAKEAIKEYSIAQNDPEYNGGGGCLRFCDNALDEPWGRFAGPNRTSTRLCCDGVWLPSFTFRNANELPEGRIEPLYEIAVAPDNQTVTWRLSARGDFFTPMDFHRFPFDKQDLVIEISTTQTQPDKIVIVPSATQHELFMRGPGDDLSTWTVQGVHVLALPPVRGSDLTKSSTAVDPGDPSPQSVVGATPAQIANSIVPNLWFHGAQVHIIVARNHVYFVWVGVVPVILMTYIAHLVRFMGTSNLNERIAVLITLLLALVALQWLVLTDLPNSSYLLPTSELVLLAYTCMAVLLLVSVAVYHVRSHKRLYAERLAKEATALRYSSVRASMHDGRNAPGSREHASMQVGIGAGANKAVEHVELHVVPANGTAGHSANAAPRAAKVHDTSSALHHLDSLSMLSSMQLGDRLTWQSALCNPRQLHNMLYSRLRRRLLYWHVVLMDEDFALLLAARLDGWCHLVVFFLFNCIAVMLLAVPHMLPSGRIQWQNYQL